MDIEQTKNDNKMDIESQDIMEIKQKKDPKNIKFPFDTDTIIDITQGK